MSRILFLISVLSGGGAARVVSVLANHFSRRPEFHVSLVSHTSNSGYQLDTRVEFAALYKKEEVRSDFWNKVWRRLAYWPRLISAIRRTRPDVVIVMVRGMNWRGIVACKLLGLRVVVTEHTNHEAEQGFWSWIERRLVYRLADRLIVLTEFDREFYARYLPRVSLIPNPLSFSPVRSDCERSPVLIAVGDLNRWHIKGFDTLVSIFARIAPKFPEWKLRIVGGGESGMQTISAWIVQYGLEGRVELLGFCSDVDREMRGSEIFVLTSRYEGFSMALLEAMSQGCACVSFDCNAGPADLIEPEISGLLVSDQAEDQMQSAIERLMSDEDLRRRLGRAAIRASHAFDVTSIERMWISVFDSQH